jgi:hypothetical protein
MSIALVGQQLAQIPQPSQLISSTTATSPSATVIAFLGHAFSHLPQLIQRSLVTSAIISSMSTSPGAVNSATLLAAALA